VFAATGLVVMTAVIGWQVFARYVLSDSPAWAEAASLALMVWFILLAAAVGVREQFHIGMTAATNAMPPALAKLSRAFSLLMVGAFGAAMGVWGGELVIRTWDIEIATLGISRGFSYLPLPIAGWLIPGGRTPYQTPEQGLMNKHLTFIDRYSAIALNRIAGRRAISGNSTSARRFTSSLP